MEFNEYQEKSRETNLMGRNLLYHILGLISEVGELSAHIEAKDHGVQETFTDMVVVGERASLLKKRMRDKGIDYGDYTFDSSKMYSELSDCLWYEARIADCIDALLSEVAEYNLMKLAARKERGTLTGSGEDR